MIRTLLVANRGEIARRIIRTARAMGIRTVALFSEPDATAAHVTEADRAVALGGFSPGGSYLDQHKVLDAARRSGADAVHPGYGFLSENAAFAQACLDAGLCFVGPDPDAIATMGLKDRAKDIARKAGVPVLPDAKITGEDVEQWRQAAALVGYPMLVKATAGGGGKGMRLVTAPEELADAVTGARREAGSAFGNADVFCERYLTAPRHIEIQVFGDMHGGSVHLGERECSVQRRHQKVVEEAPSPVLDEALRGEMGATAVALVRELGYVGAGTVEYLYDEDTGEFFFLEMNTRLQVEHPVTEEVTGLDLVRLQLEVAMGHPLALQHVIAPHGHAIEVRLYAEDPSRDFLPTPGVLHRYVQCALPGIRYEDGVVAPEEISAHYDPMLAKVIARAESRQEAARRLSAALAGMHIHGPVTNRDFLAALLCDPDFLAGATRTDFIERHSGLTSAGCPTPLPVHLGAAVAVTAARRRTADPVTGHAPPGWRLLPGSPRTSAGWEQLPGSPVTVSYRLSASAGTARLALSVDDADHQLGLRELGPDCVRVEYGGVEWPCTVTVHSDGTVWVNDSDGQTGWRPQPRLPDPETAQAAGGPVAEVPGTVVAVRVQSGDRVQAGQQLVVLEAMKMEHPSVAAADGVVEQVHVEVGQYVEAHAVLVTLGPTT